MRTNPTENVVDIARATLETKSVKAAAPTPRPAPRAEHYWFVFDRWLPSTSGPEDEFVLA